MSNRSEYIVQSGDNLTAIARQHGTSSAELQKLNPIIRNPDNIQPGWKLKLPPRPAAANDTPILDASESGASSLASLPPARHTDDCSSTQTQAGSPCSAELIDVVHITGDPYFYVLTEAQVQDLKREIDRVQLVMTELQDALADSGQRVDCQKEQNADADCSCVRCKKDEWSKKAEEAGLLCVDPTGAQPQPTLTSEEDIQGQLTKLRQAREWYVAYNPVLALDAGNMLESNWESLRAEKLKQLDAEIVRLRGLLKSESEGSATLANSARPNFDYARSGSRQTQSESGTRRRSGITVVEVSLFGQPDRRYYVAARFHEQVDWKTKVSTRVLQGKPFGKQLAKQLLDDIRNDLGNSRRASPLGSLEAKLISWSSKEDNLLNALHKEVTWTSNSDDAAPYAISAEAHALRFAASASAGVNSWDPAGGNIEVGAKGSAAFSLAEGSVALSSFFPSQGGRTMQLAYRNANGETVLHPFGVFRLQGKLEVSCFVGAQVQGSVGARVQYKPSDEGPSGATALLGSPQIETGRGGYIGIKGDAFAGAQAGGALSGALQWIEPSKIGRGKIVSGQSNASSSWTSLAEIKGEGNGALGIGAGFDFGLTIRSDRLAFNCNGRLVFGPGAGGGFATVVDLENTYKVVTLLCDALSEVDYHYLLSVNADAFNYVAYGLYQIASQPGRAAVVAFDMGQREMKAWWQLRQTSKYEAENLAHYLVRHEAVIVNGQRLSIDRLPPETLGPMAYMLSERFVESWHEDQEAALVLLLSHVRTWRQMLKLLEHCSPRGETVNGMESLDRLNRLVDGSQQQEFNRFIESLAVNHGSTPRPSGILAWTPSDPVRKRGVLMAARSSGLFNGLA
ncbi:LysM domain-containing protein [Pseudomonas sp. 5Ae-yellow]|uniref:LysM peptidoglycan-binding domain-containing protein n=1 Tax=Pseudomonas sp. 5Ae-yellow TaxID=2759848 RepID=UPI0015F6D4BF|nr:LysM domain-containing protein [Pseudomonas sp. 5Ae-yellow]MBA6421744.1 LysM peptidoglycan-binding domain-containing protein [Pseudomonas sp. 5Ae-yellow]|tara:strand:+ start:1213 stop:3765 length:2553 start_codon:yes stop_codon:yes gene_type:complete